MFFSSKKFAFIGTGFIFRKHVQAIYKIGGKIVDVVDISHGFQTWKEMVKNTDANWIVILTPNYLHFEMAKFSAENGKMVLCEKPLVLKSEEVKILSQYPNIFTVCQLRYHPFVEKLKSEISQNKNYQIDLNIFVHRDEDYWKSWKGDPEKSGGILFNLGIHYFDLLLYLFGKPIEISTELLADKKAKGKISGKNYLCNWEINAQASKESQERSFKINGINYDFFTKENLHFYVYKDLLGGKGVTPEETLKSIELIEKIYASYRK